jgi:hypothetical protein
MKSRYAPVVFLMLFAILVPALAQKSGQTPQSSGSPQANSQQSASQGGITSGSAPIEATAFAYAALDKNAEQIAKIVAKKAPDKTSKVVVTTPTDLPVLLQWRAVLAQTNYIQGRLDNITSEVKAQNVDSLQPSVLVNSSCPVPSTPPAPGLNPNAPKGQKPGAPPGNVQLKGAGAGATTGSSSGPVWPAELQAVSQALGSVAGFNQSISSSAGSMTDQPLIDGVAQRLDAVAYVPSMQTPKVLDSEAIGDGPLGKALDMLEKSRQAAVEKSETLALYLPDWQTAAANTNCSAAQKQTAQANVAKWKPLFDLLNSAISSVDAYETSLFAGQNSSYQPQSSSALTQGGTTPSTSTVPTAGQTGTGNQGSQGQAPGQGAQSQQPGSILQQILPAELLFKALGASPLTSESNIRFLQIHALESGGSLLTKTTSIFGNAFTSLHFSGGSVAEFTLFGPDGEVQCSGTAVAYVGFIKPTDVFAVLNDPAKLNRQMAARSFSNCAPTPPKDGDTSPAGKASSATGTSN